MYLHDWKDGGFFKMASDFGDWYGSEEEYNSPIILPEYHEGKRSQFRTFYESLAGIEVLLASYSYQYYSGDAFVLFRKDGKLYEVNGGHCSCNGLEGQWEPEETTVEALRMRLDKGTLGTNDYCGNEFAAELRQVLDSL